MPRPACQQYWESPAARAALFAPAKAPGRGCHHAATEDRPCCWLRVDSRAGYRELSDTVFAPPANYRGTPQASPTPRRNADYRGLFESPALMKLWLHLLCRAQIAVAPAY